MTGADLREAFKMFSQRNKNNKIKRKEYVAIFDYNVCW